MVAPAITHHGQALRPWLAYYTEAAGKGEAPSVSAQGASGKAALEANQSKPKSTSHSAAKQPPRPLRGQLRRAVAALLAGPISRAELDVACAAANSPELVRRLRARGLQILTDEGHGLNRFGDPVSFARYSLPDHQHAAALALIGEEGEHG